MDDTKHIVTPEHVTVTYALAGIGTRFGAVLLDTCLQVILAVLLAWAFGFNLLSLAEPNQGAWWMAILGLALFAIVWGYYVLWETVWSGQTPGKRLAGIRVLRDGGYPVDFRAVLIRNIVRLADFLPFGYGAGALAMFLSKESKRLGDYAAGTIVVADARALPNRPAMPSEAPPVYQLLGNPALLRLRAITREQFSVVERFLERAIELPPGRREELAAQVGAPLMQLIGLPPAGPGYPYEKLLRELADACRRLESR